MKTTEIKNILKAFNFFNGLKIEGVELDKDEQLFLGLVHARLDRQRKPPKPVYIHGDEFSSLLGKDVPLKEVREALEHKGLIQVRNYSMEEGRPRNYLLSAKVTRALKSPKKHEYVRYQRRERIKLPEKQLDLHLALRFERVGLDSSVVELLDGDFNEREISRIAHDVWRILGMQHYSKIGKTGRDFTLINGIKSELRHYLTYDGKRLVEGDIRSCHPSLLLTFFANYNLSPIEQSAYLKCVQSKDFYGYIFNKINLRPFENAKERKKFKTDWNSWLNSHKDTAIESIMRKLFPELTAKIMEFGKENARILQRIESSVLVDHCYSFAEEWERPYFSIHDGFMCYENDFEGFKLKIQKAFREKLGFDLKIINESDKIDDSESGWIDPEKLQAEYELRKTQQALQVETSPYIRDKQYLDTQSIRYTAHDDKEFMEIGQLMWHPKTGTARAPETNNEKRKFKSLSDCIETLKPKDMHVN